MDLNEDDSEILGTASDEDDNGKSDAQRLEFFLVFITNLLQKQK